jgi:predicted helicase
VSYAELWGSRESKYAKLLEATSSEHVSAAVSPYEPFFLFKPQDIELRKEYEAFSKINEIMPKYGIGCFTSKDHFAIGFDAEALIENAKAFRDSVESNQALCERLGISIKEAWDVTKARELIQKERMLDKFVRPILYRPFDYRLIFYHPSLVWSMSMPTMRHMLGGHNLALAIGRAGGAIDQGPWNIIICTNSITDLNLYRRGGNSLFPLYHEVEKETPQAGLQAIANRRSNFSRDFLTQVSNILGRSQDEYGLPQGIFPEDIFHFAYAVFYSASYRTRYAEFLKIDFPRLPLTSNLKLFYELAQLGAELVALHLMESPTLSRFITTYTGPKSPEVGRVGWSDDTVWLDAPAMKRGQPAKPGTIGFRGVPEDVWNFHIGGYQVCEKWLKDRKGRTLSQDDIVHYQKIVLALNETLRLMKEIDEIIEAHGGWPGAFIKTQTPQEKGYFNVQMVAEEKKKYGGRKS